MREAAREQRRGHRHPPQFHGINSPRVSIQHGEICNVTDRNTRSRGCCDRIGDRDRLFRMPRIAAVSRPRNRSANRDPRVEWRNRGIGSQCQLNPGIE